MCQPEAAPIGAKAVFADARVESVAFAGVLGPAHQLAVQQPVQQPVGGGVDVGQRVDAVHDVDVGVRAAGGGKGWMVS